MKHARTFPHQPESVPAARRFVTGVLRGVAPDTLEAIELMVSELATNCIRHTDSGFELTITRADGDIRVEATDGAGGTPEMRSPEPTDPSGRGLKIIDMLSAEWGVGQRSASGQDRVVHGARHGAGVGLAGLARLVWSSVSSYLRKGPLAPPQLIPTRGELRGARRSLEAWITTPPRSSSSKIMAPPGRSSRTTSPRTASTCSKPRAWRRHGTCSRARFRTSRSSTSACPTATASSCSWRFATPIASPAAWIRTCRCSCCPDASASSTGSAASIEAATTT